MTKDTFNAVVARESDDGVLTSIAELNLDDLPDKEVLVKVDYSTLNYKDALAVTGRGRICRRMPMVCGIDLAGTVMQSESDVWSVGDKVLLNGYGSSETEWGGYSQYQRVSADHLLRIPPSYDSQTAMAIGTAGYTAMLCVQAIQDHGLQTVDGPVLVSGASGGVGSIALMLLSKLGYHSVAISGRESTHDYLKQLGATEVLARAEFDRVAKPLEAEAWAAGIDSVGSKTLATMLAQTRYDGIVAACGLAGGFDLPGSVMPFILRGITLKGIDSVMAPMARRQRAWQSLAGLISADDLTEVTTVKPMSALPDLAYDLLEGRLRGRVVIDVNA